MTRFKPWLGRVCSRNTVTLSYVVFFCTMYTFSFGTVPFYVEFASAEFFA
jgi:cytochrome c oxidase assembly protein Cox11